MCFYLSISKDAQTLKNRFNAEFPDEERFFPSEEVNGFEHPELPVITQDDPGKLTLLHWGMVPAWVNDPDRAKNFRSRTLNARAETAFSKPSFRVPVRQQRCLVPADAFYEWQHAGKKKIKYRIRCKEEIFCFGGVWDIWTDPIRHEIWRGFSILTTEANPLLAGIHNTKQRMPVIISVKQEKNWLDPELNSAAQLLPFFEPYPEKHMHAEKVV
jgi:putative SOS response-associated peptidase YedK